MSEGIKTYDIPRRKLANNGAIDLHLCKSYAPFLLANAGGFDHVFYEGEDGGAGGAEGGFPEGEEGYAGGGGEDEEGFELGGGADAVGEGWWG